MVTSAWYKSAGIWYLHDLFHLSVFFELGLLLILFKLHERKLERMVVELNRKPLASNYCDEALSVLYGVSGILAEADVKRRNN